ncbi:MAG: small multi-drug export protein [Actinomycetia bacterium]|nr:small multi-drug export protein [Actinomycetes bacterium]
MGVTNPMAVAITSTLPVVEMRAGIPLGRLVLGMDPFPTWISAVVGNLSPLPVLFWFLGVCDRYCTTQQLPWMRRFLDRLYARTRRHHTALFVRLRDMALVVLVAIPIPLTGGWTGVLASYVFGVPFRKAFGLIALGVAIAATAISLMVNAGIIMWS